MNTFFRYLIPGVLLVFLSCSAPKTVILYEGSSHTPGFQAARAEGNSNSRVVVSALPNLAGGNREITKRIKYPDEAVHNGVEGIVTVRFIIDDQGKTGEFSIIQDPGYGFAKAVIDALKGIRYENISSNRYLWEVKVEFKL